MGLEAITVGLMAGGLGLGLYEAAQKPKKPAPVGVPPAPVDGTADATGKKRRAYRPAAQLFKDDDLRLGSAGKLGM